MGKLVDIVGETFGKLHVIKRIPGMTNKRVYYECLCECGNSITVRGESIRCGHTSSCGCRQREVVHNLKLDHGLCGTAIYRCWASMIQRCYSPKNKHYGNYGGRGITVCAEWRDDFKIFCEWAINAGWKIGLEIDRIENDKGYSPDNCHIVTKSVNQRNKRTNCIVTYRGESAPLVQHCEDLNLYYDVVWNRLFAYGWSVERALGTPTNLPFSHMRPSRRIV